MNQNNFLVTLCIGSLLMLLSCKKDDADTEPGVALPADTQPRVFFNARLEPKQTVLSGAGQTNPQRFLSYASAVGDSARPVIYMDYYYTLYLDNDSWSTGTPVERLKKRLFDPIREKIVNLSKDDKGYVIPQIGLGLNQEGLVDQNGQPIITYEKVADGSYDDRLDALVDALAALDRPVFLRVGYEFNGPWNGYKDPETYKKAFIRVVTKIRARGLNNVAIVWCVAAFEGNRNYIPYYPGDEYVDWWGIDLFTLWHFTDPMTPAFLQDAMTHQKPVMIGESMMKGFTLKQGGSEKLEAITGDGNKLWDQWYKTYFDFIKQNPQVKAFCYINDHYDASNPDTDWRNSKIELNEVVRTKFKQELKSPLFSHARSKAETLTLLRANNTQ